MSQSTTNAITDSQALLVMHAIDRDAKVEFLCDGGKGLFSVRKDPDGVTRISVSGNPGSDTHRLLIESAKVPKAQPAKLGVAHG